MMVACMDQDCGAESLAYLRPEQPYPWKKSFALVICSGFFPLNPDRIPTHTVDMYSQPIGPINNIQGPKQEQYSILLLHTTS
jgi:hypothetical protein